MFCLYINPRVRGMCLTMRMLNCTFVYLCAMDLWPLSLKNKFGCTLASIIYWYPHIYHQKIITYRAHLYLNIKKKLNCLLVIFELIMHLPLNCFVQVWCTCCTSLVYVLYKFGVRVVQVLVYVLYKFGVHVVQVWCMCCTSLVYVLPKLLWLVHVCAKYNSSQLKFLI